MRIRAGFTLGYECAQSTPMLFMLDIHPSRRQDLLTEQVLQFDQYVQPRKYIDGFGNSCTRILAPPGLTHVSTSFDIYDTGEPDIVNWNAIQHEVQDLPDEVLVYLLGSRYCDTDKLASFAWSQFGHIPPGWGRVQAICDYVHNHITFNYQNADSTRSAYGGWMDRTGVCRDFAHLAVTLCRCMNVPARYCTGYLGDIGVTFAPAPMDFSAWFQAYLGGQWYTFDARHNFPRIGRILMATGRDATDVALSTNFGSAILSRFDVVTDELVEVS